MKPAPAHPAPPRRRVRRRAPVLALAMAGSLSAHGAIMVASLCSEPPPAAATPVAATERSPRKLPLPGSSTRFSMQADLRAVWSPPPAIEACFDFPTVERMRSDFQMFWQERQCMGAEVPRTWSETLLNDEDDAGGYLRAGYLEELNYECLHAASTAAMIAGWSDGDRALLDVKYQDRSPLTAAPPGDDAAIEDRLRCCYLQVKKAIYPS